jgi:hypothetical protein
MPSLGISHYPRSATIPGGTHSLGTTQQHFGSMNVEGPQGSYGTIKTSSTSQYSFYHTSLPFIATLNHEGDKSTKNKMKEWGVFHH